MTKQQISVDTEKHLMKLNTTVISLQILLVKVLSEMLLCYSQNNQCYVILLNP